MPERIPGLPDRLAPPAFFADAYAVSRARARRRRRRQLALTAGGLVSVSTLLAGALLLQGPGGRQVLVPARTVPGTSGVTPTFPAADASPSPDATVASDATRPNPSPRPTGLVPTRAPATVHSSTSPRPSAPPAQPDSPSSGPEPTVTTYDARRQCGGSGPTATQGFCSYYDGALTARRGSVVQLAASVCRLPGQGSGTLRTEDGQWASFAISTNATGVLWDWSTGRRFVAEPRTFTVAAGSCLRFAVSWDLRGDDGRPLGAGDYALDAVPHAKAGTGAYVSNKAVETFTIT